jgi:hypothetical protein
VLAFDLDTARNASVWTVAGAILLALLAVWVVKHVVSKVLTVVILLAIAGLVWSQRTELNDCADNVQATIDQNLSTATRCKFFGRDVTVPALTTPATQSPSGATTTTVPD